MWRHFSHGKSALGQRTRRRLICAATTLSIIGSFSAFSAFAADPTTVSTDAVSAEERPSIAFIELRLNGLAQSSLLTVLLNEKTNELWLNENDMRRLRLVTPKSPKLRELDGQRYVAVTSIPDAKFEFDRATQSASLVLPPPAFDSDQAIARAALATMIPARNGYSGFFSYDVYAERVDSRLKSGGIFDIALSTPVGLLSSTQFVTQGVESDNGNRTRFRRLDSTFTADYPDRLGSLRLGDFIAQGVNLSQATRLGGFQFATNFAVRPGFATYPVSSINGQATLPSVAELFVNGVSTASRSVAPGPFTFNEVPLVNGAGEVRLVVRDVLGREQTSLSSFYGSSQLLAPGLSDYSFSLGRLRYNYGTVSNDYRDMVSSAFWRYGVTPRLTTAVNADLSKRIGNVGGGASYLLPGVAEINAAAALSRTRVEPEAARPYTAATNGTGYSVLLGADRRTAAYAVGAKFRFASPSYRGLAEGNAQLDGVNSSRIRREFSAYASVGFGAFGSLTASYFLQSKELAPGVLASGSTDIFSATRDTQVFALGYNLSLGGAGLVTVGASRSGERRKKEPTNTSFFVNYFLPLNALHSVGLSSTRTEVRSHANADQAVESSSTHTNHLLTAQRTLPEGEGYGYRVQVGDPSLLRLAGKLALGTAVLAVDYSRTGGSQGLRASVSGALAATAGSITASRRIPDSFLVVDAGGFSNVRVFLDNNLIGRTDAAGRIVVPTVISYQPHTISIDPTDLPLSAEVDQTRIEITTAPRSGAVLTFPVRASSSALIRLHDEFGNPVPAGAVAFIGSRTFPVAGDGEVFLTGLVRNNEISVQLGKTSCRFDVLFAASNVMLPNLGTYICRLR